MLRPTASAVERVLRCPGSMALPLIHTTSPAADRGTAIHAYLEAVAGGADPEEALADVADDWRPICALIDFARLPKDLAAEVAFAYDLTTGKARELGRGLGRKYSGLAPTELAGTADLVGVSEDAVFVLDYKTGWGDVAAAAENLQLRTLALAAARAYDRERAVVEIRRIKEDGASWGDRAELDEFDLDAFAEELRPLQERIREAQAQAATRGGMPDVSTGPWCRHCPAWESCPAKKTLIQRAVAAAGAGESLYTQPTTAAQYGAAWMLAKAMQSVGRRLEKQVREVGMPEFGELPLPGGKVLREVLDEGDRKLDGRVVFAVVKDLHGAELADAAIEITASQAGIERALKAAPAGTIPPRGVAKAKRDILAAVEKRGGVSRPQEKKFVEVDAARPPAVEGAGPSPAPLPAAAPRAEDDPDAKDLVQVRDRLERVLGLEKPEGEMHLLHHRIKLGMEGNPERWSPLLLLWGKANEAIKERAA